jgi:hypothetical protein
VSGWVKEGGWDKRKGTFIPFAHANGTDFITNDGDKSEIGNRNWQ